MEYKGSCLCGNIEFKVVGEIKRFYLCHCDYCRKDTGSAHAANLFFDCGELYWKKGELDVVKFNHQGTRHSKSFCSRCGSGMPIKEGNVVIVPAGSLDRNIDRRPDAHIFMGSKGNWDHDLEYLETYKTFPVQDNG
mgnify:CR=1 FL=1